MKDSPSRRILQVLGLVVPLAVFAFVFFGGQRDDTRKMEFVSLKGEGEEATAEFRTKKGGTLFRKLSAMDLAERQRVLSLQRAARFKELGLELHYKAFRVHQVEGKPVDFVFNVKNAEDGMSISVRDLQVQAVESTEFEGEKLPPREWSASFEHGPGSEACMALAPKPREGFSKRRITELHGHVDVDIVATKTFSGSVTLPRKPGEKRTEALGDHQVELECREDGLIAVKAVDFEGFTGSAGFRVDDRWELQIAAADAGETAKVEAYFIGRQPFAEGRLPFGMKSGVANP